MNSTRSLRIRRCMLKRNKEYWRSGLALIHFRCKRIAIGASLSGERMRTPEEIAQHLVQHIGHIFKRPLMYGGNAAGVDLILDENLALWAFVVGRDRDFLQVRNAELQNQECGSANFSTRYQMKHPSATDQENVEYVVRCWQSVVRALDLTPTSMHA